MVDRFADYPESATNLASLFENIKKEDLETKALETQAFEILKTMNPKELAIYMADNIKCDRGLELASKYLKEQNEVFREKFNRYIRHPVLLELPDDAEDVFYPPK